MTLTEAEPETGTPRRRPRPAAGRPLWRRRPPPDLAVLGGIALAAMALSLLAHAHHLAALLDVARGSLASLLLFGVCGDALCRALVPAAWGMPGRLLAIPLGAASSGLVLTAFGLARVPLHASLWVVLAAGLAASVWIRRRPGPGAAPHRAGGRGTDRRAALVWLATLAILFCVALLPAWRTGQATIFGENPDAHQVAGIAVLFQHVPPTATDNALPIDVVPPAWRFRYPIFYPLAGASNLGHFDPIHVFPGMAALLMVCAALGFGMLAVRRLGAPAVAGPAVAAAIGFSWVIARLGWHPYWNQLWGLAMLPYALLFGWEALAERDGRSALLCLLVLVMLDLAYPLALPYPLLLLAALAVGYRHNLRLRRGAGRRRLLWGALGVFLLAPALLGAAVKLSQGVSQLLSTHSSLWSGDVTTLTPVGKFVGTGGGVLPAAVVLGFAVLSLALLPRRIRWSLGIAVLLLLALDVRFRTAGTGAYMDFKHLSFVGSLVLAMAASAVAALICGRVRLPRGDARLAVVLGLAVAGGWTVAALRQTRGEGAGTEPQVTPAMFGIRRWAARLPPGASVRVDIPASGVQLWAVYMLGDHPVDTPAPVLHTTYAHAPWGLRAAYALTWRYFPNRHPSVHRPVPPLLFAQNPPLFENKQFVLRRVAWPTTGRLAAVRDTSSTALVEP